MNHFWLGFLAGAAFLAACEALVMLATVAFFARLDRATEQERAQWRTR